MQILTLITCFSIWRCAYSDCRKPAISNSVLIQYPDGEDGTKPIGEQRMIEMTCKPGYNHVRGDPVVICLDSEWKVIDEDGLKPAVLFHCAEKQCPVINPLNGYAELRGKKILYTCRKGFYLDGPKEAFCRLNKQGNYFVAPRKPPDCKRETGDHLIRCIKPVLPNMTTDEHTEYRVGEKLKFSCERGFKLIGPSTLTCQLSGTWSEDFPNCEEKPCPAVAPENGFAERKDRKIIYTCKPGYRLKGHKEAFCRLNKNGDFLVKNPPECLEEKQEEKELVQCKLPILSFLSHNESFHNIGDTVVFTCDYGYRLVGQKSLSCGIDATWNDNFPQCDVPNLLIAEEEIKFGENITFSCDYGYVLHGNDYLTCDDDTWKKDLPICSKVKCDSPDVPNLVVFGNEFHFGDTITFECQSGYRREGTNFTTCDISGNWTDGIPTCSKIYCKLPDVPHLLLVDSDDGINDTVFEVGNVVVARTFKCDVGYNLKESADLICGNDGDWTGVFPHCVEKLCPIMHPDNGFAKLSNGNVAYFCNPGYHIVGHEETMCFMNEYGDFEIDDVLPECKKDEIPRIKCLSPNIPYLMYDGFDYFSGDTATFSCQKGYQLTGHSKLICDSDGNWSNPMPYCTAVGSRCSDPGDSAFSDRGELHSYQVGISVIYKCHEGYELQNKETRGIITCLPNGTWSEERPICIPFEKQTCPKIPPQNNLKIDTNSERLHPDVFLSGDEVHLSCLEKYSTQHKILSLTCQQNGNWDSDIPVCTEMGPCPRPSVPQNGRIIELDMDNRQEFPIGFEINLVCDENYETQPAVYGTICIGNTWKDKLQNCIPITCNDPGLPHGGFRVVSDFSVGSTVKYTCLGNNKLLGSQERTCLPNGRWNGSTTICYTNRSDCIDPGIPDNSYRSGLKFQFGNVVEYSCKIGYKLMGNGTRECLLNGHWSGEEINCVGEGEFSDPAELKKLLKKLAEVAVISSSVSRVNVIFLWDGSASINKYHFEWSKKFIKSVIRKLNTTRDSSVLRVGTIFFSSSASKIFNVDLRDIGKVLHLVDEVNRTETGTNIMAALTELQDLMSLIETHERNSTKSKTVVFVLTDGRVNEGGSALGKIDDLHKKFEIIFHVVAIGAKINKPTLNNISSHGLIFSNGHKLFGFNNGAQKDTRKKLDEDFSSCGLENLAEDDSILFGSKKLSLKQPWMVAFYFEAAHYHIVMAGFHKINQKVLCDGVIIHKKWILSAASCFSSENLQENILRTSPYNWQIFAGNSRLAQAINQIISHPFINIALVELIMPISFDAYVRPACLLPLFPSDEIFYQTQLQTVTIDWDRSKNNLSLEFTDSRREIEVSFSSNKNCQDGFKSAECVTDQLKYCESAKPIFCAEIKDEKFDVCSVGGNVVPLMQKISFDVNEKSFNRWFVIGIRNHAIKCKKNDHIFYTNVAKLRSWILNETKTEHEEVKLIT